MNNVNKKKKATHEKLEDLLNVVRMAMAGSGGPGLALPRKFGLGSSTQEVSGSGNMLIRPRM